SGILMNIVIGVVGAFGTGLVLNLLGIDVHSGGYWFTFFIALGGAAVLLWLVGLVRKT
ncbi:MAG: GlsB/YeaQ/YmgE family stress response membrane protein, partial [Mycobacterium sp.]